MDSGAGEGCSAECPAMLQGCFHCWSAVCHSAIAIAGGAYPGAFSGSPTWIRKRAIVAAAREPFRVYHAVKDDRRHPNRRADLTVSSATATSRHRRYGPCPCPAPRVRQLVVTPLLYCRPSYLAMNAAGTGSRLAQLGRAWRMGRVVRSRGPYVHWLPDDATRSLSRICSGSTAPASVRAARSFS